MPFNDVLPLLCVRYASTTYYLQLTTYYLFCVRYASAAELYRACTELGRVWSTVGKQTGRNEVSLHGAQLLKLAPQLYEQLHRSLSGTVRTTATRRCWPAFVEARGSRNFSAYIGGQPPPFSSPPSFRGYAEMLYSGAMTREQAPGHLGSWTPRLGHLGSWTPRLKVTGRCRMHIQPRPS